MGDADCCCCWLGRVRSRFDSDGFRGDLAARTEQEHYENELERERREIIELPDYEREEVAEVFREWGLQEDLVESAVNQISSYDKSN
ncbi:VIT1/CCC1 transporter family protein [Paenibacillus glycanilyticus]|uniref:VIT1/CCC1 transporter family protein n=1 Tax=Paenibacillus glycanilyticus TaxID=126569 RepID=UPI003EB81946